MSGRRLAADVAIVGAGPAGLILSRLLAAQGVSSVVVERRSRAYVEKRLRAGILEQPTVALLREIGAAWRLDREAEFHRGFYVRVDRATHRLDFEALLGRGSCVYGQAELVKDLVHDHLEAGRPLYFEADGVMLDGFEEVGSADVAPTVAFRHAGEAYTIDCAVIAGCDGARGASRPALRAAAERAGAPIALWRRDYRTSWLGILARSTPPTPEGMYCAHPDGMSLHSMRGSLSRQYLQVDADDTLEDWPDDRIWTELRRRSASDDAPPLETGEILERSLVPLTAAVLERFQHGRLALAGDAAHTVPPAGAKGLNLAVGDVVVLARAITALCAGEPEPFRRYTETAAPRVWQGQSFSAGMTAMLHRLGEDPFERQVQRARLRALLTSVDEQRAHGEAYLGLPFGTGWRWTPPGRDTQDRDETHEKTREVG